MSLARQYFENALYCELLAEKVVDRELKMFYLRFAQQWLDLASQALLLEQPRSSTGSTS
jgi:hypothetical protein